MDKGDFTVRVGAKDSSLIVTIPKKIAEKLVIKKGDILTYGVVKDLISIRKTDSDLPIDKLTRDLLDFIAKRREILAEKLRLQEDYLDDLDSTKLETRINEIERTEKMLSKEFNRLKKEFEKIFGSIGETFAHPPLNEMDDVLYLEKFLIDSQLDYDITMDYIKKLVQHKSKYQDLVKKTELLKEDRKIPSLVASEIKSKFTQEIDSCERILEKIAKAAGSL